jgi:hypothetical protein
VSQNSRAGSVLLQLHLHAGRDGIFRSFLGKIQAHKTTRVKQNFIKSSGGRPSSRGPCLLPKCHNHSSHCFRFLRVARRFSSKLNALAPIRCMLLLLSSAFWTRPKISKCIVQTDLFLSSNYLLLYRPNKWFSIVEADLVLSSREISFYRRNRSSSIVADDLFYHRRTFAKALNFPLQDLNGFAKICIAAEVIHANDFDAIQSPQRFR